MSKSIPPLLKHQDHQVEVRTTHHHNGAFYHCVSCSKWIAWLSKQEVKEAAKLGLL